MLESLKILISIRTLRFFYDRPISQNLLQLLPENRTVWMARSSPNHETSLRMIPYVDLESQQKVFDLHIFNTGQDISMHEIRHDINRTRFAKYRKVPFALLSLESIFFRDLFVDPEAILKGSNMTNLTWLLYPDDIF